MLKACAPEKETEVRVFSQECHELLLIFQKIISTLIANQKNE